MTSESEARGLSLYQAARQMGVPFHQEVEPRDRWLEVHGLRFHYLDWGDLEKFPLVLLHGNAQQCHSWDMVALALCDSYRVIVPDARGHGDSDWAPDGDYSTEAYQRDLEGLLSALDLEELALVGHSMGGRTAYIHASRQPEKMKALVIVDSGPVVERLGLSRINHFKHLPDEADNYEELVARVQEYTGRSREQVTSSLKHSVRQLPSGRWTWKYDRLLRTAGATPLPWPPERLWEFLRQVQCPTLVVRGEHSDIFSQDTMERMLQVLRHCQGAVVPGAGHLVPGDNPSALARLLHRWLGEVL